MSDLLRCRAGWLVVLLAVLGVLPFVLLSLFAHPSADDWYMAADTLEKGFWKANADYYMGTTGRFFSSAVLFMHPMLFSFGAFKIYSACLVLGLLAGLRFAVGAWFPAASMTWKWAATVAFMTLFLWGMASPAQGFYWGTGSAGYTVPAILSLVILGLFGKRCLERSWKPHPVLLLSASLLAVAATGCTEVSMALLLSHVLALNLVFVWRNHQVGRPLLVLLAATLAGAAVVMLSPGNSHRGSLYSNGVNHVLMPALGMALKLGIKQAAVWLVFTPFCLFSLVAVAAWPARPEILRKRGCELVVLSMVLMLGTVLGPFFLGTWSMGAALPLRAVNLVLLFFIIDWVILIAGCSALLRSFNLNFPRLGMALPLGAFLAFCVHFGLSDNKVRGAWRDLLSGSAARYDQESSQRYAVIRSADQPDVVVPPLKARPPTIFFNDLTPDPANWRNTGCARFFQKHSVALPP